MVIYRRAGIEQCPPLLLWLKLLLRDVHPAVWRRVKLADSLSIADLHRVIQLLMGWDDDHLHRFRIHGRDYGIAYVGGPSFDEDAAAVRLAQFGFRPTERFLYEWPELTKRPPGTHETVQKVGVVRPLAEADDGPTARHGRDPRRRSRSPPKSGP